MSNQIRPLADRVLVQPLAEERSAGGIIIPDAAQEKPSRGKVLAVGPQVEGVAAGDTVIISKYGGFEFVDPGTQAKVLLVGLSNVFAVLE